MSDLPPSSDPAVAAAIAAMSPEERAALLADVTGIQPAAAAPPVTSAAQSAASRDRFASLGVVSGHHEQEFTTRKPEEFGSVTLVVDGERYECGGEVPVDYMDNLLTLAGTKDRLAMLAAMRDLIRVVMVPDSLARYNARCAGVVEVDDPEAPTGKRRLPAITMSAMADHGAYLTGVYMGRPTVTPPVSGSGGDSTGTSGSTAGASPAE